MLSQSDASGVFIPRPDGRLYVAAGYGVGDEFLQALEAQGIASKEGHVFDRILTGLQEITEHLGAK